MIALACAIGLSMYALEDPGYVVLSREPYTVRLPLALFVLFALFAFAALYLLINFLVGVFRAPKRIGKWRKGKQEISAQQYTMKGFASLIEGNWADAEGNLLTKLDHNNASLMNFLGAAYAAQQQGQIARRNQHLDTALKNHPNQELAIKLTRARMQMQAGELADARDQLEYLRLSAPRSVAAGRLLADVYQQLGDWPSLVKLLPALGKLRAFPEQELAEREQLALSKHIEAPALLQGDGSRVDDTFRALPRKAKKDAAAVAGYARQLIRSGEPQRAEAVLRKALNRQWNGELIKIYGATETPHLRDQIKLLESWGSKNNKTDDAAYRFAMARLLRRDNQTDAARELLTAIVNETSDAEAINELGDLLEQMGDSDSALLTYKQGMKALAGGNTEAKPAEPESRLIALGSESAGPVANTMPVVSETS